MVSNVRGDRAHGQDGDAVRVQLLGPVRAWRGEHELELGGPTRRGVLAMLAIRANQPVSRSELIDGLWGEEPPPSAVNSVHVHVAGLRRALEPCRAYRAPGQVLPASGQGYLLRLAPGQLDTEALEENVALARRSSAASDPEAAARSLGAALQLWQGTALSGIPGPRADIERARLSEIRLSLTEERIDVMLALGRSQQAVAELALLIREHPLRERFREQLMVALYRCGRQAEALAEFTGARRVLAAELGIEPGPGLQRLHQQILTGDGALGRPAQHEPVAGHDGAAPAAPRMVVLVPQELPADTDSFTGRAGELAELGRMLAAESEPGQAAVAPGAPAAARTAVIAGGAGVGKTALALRWAHQACGAFPDGQLYVNLRGYDPAEPVAAADALAGFLRALGLTGHEIPADPGERAARYRSVMHGRRVLVVLDNAAAVDQVRPLLPGTTSCAVVVTSRDSLPGLVARNGARRLHLDLLPPADAVALLRALIGERVSADPAAARRLAAQCARLPLALRVAAELAAAHPAQSLAELTGELADEQRRLDLFDAGGDPHTAVRGVFSWSYRRLPPAAARVFRLAGLHPGPDLDTYATAALAGASAGQARDALDLLTRTHLISQAGAGRYGMHDLLRAYAIDLGVPHDGAADGRQDAAGPDEGTRDEGTAALTRLFDYYLAAAAAAMDVLVPAERARRPLVSRPSTPIPPMDGPAAARAWLDAERSTLVSVAMHAAAHGWPSHASRLSAIVCRYVETGGHYTDAITIHSHARRAARESGDRVAEAHALNHLGHIEGRRGRYPHAAEYLQLSLALFRDAGDRCGAARARSNLASALWRQGRYADAAAHLDQALATFRAVGDQIGEARALNSLGLVDWQQGRYRQAAGHFRQALALFRGLGDRSNEAHALGNLGMATGRLRQEERAARYLRQALATFREIGNRSGAASTLTDLGCVACQQGRYADATRHHRQALALFREIGERAGEAEALNGLGEVLLATAQPGPAQAQHNAAMALARHIGDRHEQARAHNGLGAALLAAGLPGQARAQHEAALGLASQSGDRYEQARAQEGIAVSADALGLASQPGDRYEQARAQEGIAVSGEPGAIPGAQLVAGARWAVR